LRRALPASGYDLIMSMFKINPKERMSAAELLQHPFFHEAPLPCNASLLPAVDGLECFQAMVQRHRQPPRPKPIIRKLSPSSRSSSPSSPRHVTFDLPTQTVFFDKEEAPIAVCVSEIQLSPPPSHKKRAREETEAELWSYDEDDDVEDEHSMSVDQAKCWARPSKRPKLLEEGEVLLDSSSSTQSTSSPCSPIISAFPASPVHTSVSQTPLPPRSYPGAAANPYLAPPRVVRSSTNASTRSNSAASPL